MYQQEFKSVATFSRSFVASMVDASVTIPSGKVITPQVVLSPASIALECDKLNAAIDSAGAKMGTAVDVATAKAQLAQMAYNLMDMYNRVDGCTGL